MGRGIMGMCAESSVISIFSIELDAFSIVMSVS